MLETAAETERKNRCLAKKPEGGDKTGVCWSLLCAAPFRGLLMSKLDRLGVNCRQSTVQSFWNSTALGGALAVLSSRTGFGPVYGA